MAKSWTNDVIQLRLPLKPEYLTLLRAAVGVIAGTISFNYDEIMQLRAAVSEVFDLGVKSVSGKEGNSEHDELSIRFLPQADGLEILVTYPAGARLGLHGQEHEDNRVLLESLMDKVEFGAGKATVRMVKYKSNPNT